MTSDLMTQFICTNAYIPLRSAPSHRAEMVNQILFGERFSVTESSGNWLRVETYFDSYTGWIDSLHRGYERVNSESEGIIIGQELICKKDDGTLMTLFPGSELFGLEDDFSGFTICGRKYTLQDPDASCLTPHDRVTDTAVQYINAPYLWGGRTPAGVDCSGLVQILFKIHGKALPRDAAQQAEIGTTVNFFGEAQPGDVIFFSGETDKISHTGIFEGPGSVIHASGSVRRDRIDHQGIWRDDAGRYTHRLRIIKRIL